MNKYLVTIEFRYIGKPLNEDGNQQYISKVSTIGVFETRDEANEAGNGVLIELEKQFPLNKHWNRKERFSNSGGCFGSPQDLISDSAYLQTPFQFFAKVTKLNYGYVNDYVAEAVATINEYTIWRNQNEM